MNQERLNHVAVLRIHQEHADELDLLEITNDYVSKTSVTHDDKSSAHFSGPATDKCTFAIVKYR